LPKVVYLAGFAAVTLAAFVALVLSGAVPQSAVAVVTDLVLAALSVLAAGSPMNLRSRRRRTPFS